MSTMREESWPEPDVIVTGQGYHEHAYSVRLVRQIAEAAYAAGQRAATEQAAKVCEVIADEHWNAYKGRIEPIDKGRLFNPHTEGISDGADQCAAAIRARDKEQG